MRRLLFFLLFEIFLINSACFPVYSQKGDEWKEKPVITHIIELSKEKMLIEWEGRSPFYQVFVDGKKTATVNLNSTIIDVKSGNHQIVVVPVDFKSKNEDSDFSINLDLAGLSGTSELLRKIGLPNVKIPDIKFGLDLDLSALGIDPKDVISGNPSDITKINYTGISITNAVPEITDASMDSENRVLLSFTDKYDSNFYRIFIKNGNDVTYADYDLSAEEVSAFLTKENTRVTIVLDSEYLRTHECMVPELDQKYSFSVKLQKWPVNYVDGTKETDLVLESKESKAFDYTLYTAWKKAPVITYASQTADGEITLQWEHDDSGLGCEYKITEIDSFMGVKKSEEEISRISGKQLVINDLMDGKYTYKVTPLYSDEEGLSSEAVTADVTNKWAAAPFLECEPDNNNKVNLKWNAVDGVESYHITVFTESGSLLKFVNLDYKKYEEFNVPAKTGEMVYPYTYDKTVDAENGISLKFEIYGTRHSANGSEQKSAVTSKTVILK